MKFTAMTAEDRVKYINAQMDAKKLRQIKESINNDLDALWTITNDLEVKYGYKEDPEVVTKRMHDNLNEILGVPRRVSH